MTTNFNTEGHEYSILSLMYPSDSADITMDLNMLHTLSNDLLEVMEDEDCYIESF